MLNYFDHLLLYTYVIKVAFCKMAVGPRNKNSGSVSSSDAVHMTVIRQERTRTEMFSVADETLKARWHS